MPSRLSFRPWREMEDHLILVLHYSITPLPSSLAIPSVVLPNRKVQWFYPRSRRSMQRINGLKTLGFCLISRWPVCEMNGVSMLTVIFRLRSVIGTVLTSDLLWATNLLKISKDFHFRLMEVLSCRGRRWQHAVTWSMR